MLDTQIAPTDRPLDAPDAPGLEPAHDGPGGVRWYTVLTPAAGGLLAPGWCAPGWCVPAGPVDPDVPMVPDVVSYDDDDDDDYSFGDDYDDDEEEIFDEFEEGDEEEESASDEEDDDDDL